MRLASLMLIPFGASIGFAQPLVADFDAGIDGWTVETRTNPNGFFALVDTFLPDVVSSGGDPGGYLEEVDPDDQWAFFVAPSGWGGDRSAFLDRTLSYSTRTSSNSFPDGRLVILVGAGDQRISYDAGVPQVGVWTRRQISLSEGAWFEGTFASGVPASRKLIESVLTQLQTLYIGLEFGGDVLEERVGLDSVRFGICDADITGDGTLNFFDIAAYIALYNAGDPQADIAAPFGSLNFFDISAYIGLYNAGCP